MSTILFTLVLLFTLKEGDNNEYQFKYKLINKSSEINSNYGRADTTTCQIHMSQFISGLTSSEIWALTMLDATAKLNHGILVGNINNLGNFDQCLNVEYDTGLTGVIRGQHCMASILVDLTALGNITAPEDATIWLKIQNMQQHLGRLFGLPFNVRAELPQKLKLGLGICVPASCQADDLVEQLEMILSLVNLNLAIEFEPEASCSIKELVNLSTGDVVAIVIFGTFAVLMILSTIYDFNLMLRGKQASKKIYLSFSVYSNMKRIFAIHPNPPDNMKSDNISCVHGIRCMSIIWIVLGHRYSISFLFGFDNQLEMLAWISKYRSALILGSSNSVDTFFVISGLLLAYTFIKQRAKGVNLSIPMMYVHRYLRLTPPLAAIVLFEATLFIHMGSGPLWKKRPYEGAQFCLDYWWSALLYIQNYANHIEICVPQSWYLSVDMQVYILSPILLYGLWRYPKPAIGAAVILILANIGIAFGLVYVHEFGNESDAATLDADYDIYNPTHTRYGPMLLGMLLGYTLFKTRQIDVKLNRIFVLTMWFCAFAVMLAVIVSDHRMFQLDHKMNALEDSFSNSLNRIPWSVAICWIIFACTSGYGGLINWFLSHPLWQPLSRLSYCLYLTHLTVQTVVSFSRKSPEHFSDMDMVYQFWGDLGISLTASVLWSVAFESPVTIIEHELFRPSLKAAKKDNNQVENGLDSSNNVSINL